MRSVLALAASALAAVAAVIASLDGDADIVPFFVGLTFLAGVVTWATHSPYEGARGASAKGAALVWLLAAVWVAVLLLVFQPWDGDMPAPTSPEATYLGFTATVYHVIGLFGGAILVLVSAFGPDRWLDHGRAGAGRQAKSQAPS